MRLRSLLCASNRFRRDFFSFVSTVVFFSSSLVWFFEQKGEVPSRNVAHISISLFLLRLIWFGAHSATTIVYYSSHLKGTNNAERLSLYSQSTLFASIRQCARFHPAVNVFEINLLITFWMHAEIISLRSHLLLDACVQDFLVLNIITGAVVVTIIIRCRVRVCICVVAWKGHRKCFRQRLCVCYDAFIRLVGQQNRQLI